jgi:uroporphyrinogen-III synthase
VYAVGPATAAAADALLGLTCRGAETGSAELLAARLLEERAGAGAFFLRGDLARPTLAERLVAGGMAVEQLVVYETRPCDGLAGRLASLPLPRVIVLFSPSGVRAALPLLQRGGARLVAIGGSTAAEVTALGWGPAIVATSPDPAGVLRALDSSLSSIDSM